MSETMRDSEDFEKHTFHPEPHTSAEYLAALWQKANVIDVKISVINGRLNILEKFMWLLSGALIVVSAIVVPQFLGLVK